MEAVYDSERTKEMDQQKQQKMNKIICRSEVVNLLKAIDPANMLLQISDPMHGDVIILTLRHPRTVRRRVSFIPNIKLLVGFSIFISEIFYVSIHNEPMNQEERALLILMLLIGSMIFILLIEMSQLISHRLAIEERRLLRLVGWIQEALIITLSGTMIYWNLRTPVEPPVIIGYSFV
ncbi:uncharacterized protein LOC121251187 [Juglans microcarpa x Juglans regia]|uniref:uncharacterized protein LOC121251187 n=1 Tax=Juglans microcarpa x Juglans regia TaxID=2249226 RepID=UPI001B7F57B1|nr:uncharacterized protein LOC121251187 [Juglans microcarpa x Juglans regia]